MKINHLKLAAILCFSILAGCAIARESLPTFNDRLSSGDYRNAKAIIEKQTRHQQNPGTLLWDLQSGSVSRDLKEYQSSNKYFDYAEENFKYFDLQLTAGKTLQTGTGILLNDSFIPYKGKMYDRIMVNTYKALNFASMEDFENARIEFNRALQRQNDAKSLFQAQAANLKKQIYKEKNEKGSAEDVIDDTLNNPGLNNIVNNRYKNLDNFKIFSDFINPFSTYMAGLFFWLEGDSSKAVDILKEAYAMSSLNKTLSEDFTRVARGDSPVNEMWIIFENGLCPLIEEMRIDIPVFMFSDRMLYVGTAFPNLSTRENAYPYLSVSTNRSSVKTEILSSMDSVIASELKKELPEITLREVSRVALKTFLQYKMEKDYGQLAGIVAGIYQAMTTAVDTRIWSALPKNFQVAHLSIPDDRLARINLNGHDSLTINIPTDCKNVILYIRIVAPGINPTYHFIKFK